MPRQKIAIFVVETQSYFVDVVGLNSETTCLSLPGLGLPTFATTTPCGSLSYSIRNGCSVGKGHCLRRTYGKCGTPTCAVTWVPPAHVLHRIIINKKEKHHRRQQEHGREYCLNGWQSP